MLRLQRWIGIKEAKKTMMIKVNLFCYAVGMQHDLVPGVPTIKFS